MAYLDYQPTGEQMEDFTPVPPAQYRAMVTESDVADTKAGNGKLLKLTWTITDGEHQGRKVFDRVNLQNPNARAVEIGRKQLNTICHALGLTHVSDSVEMHDRPCLIEVRIRPAQGDYPPSNEIRGYKPLNSEAAPAPAAAAPTPARNGNGGNGGGAKPQPVAAGAPGKPPWARK